MTELDENLDIGNITPALKKVERAIRAIQKRNRSPRLDEAIKEWQRASKTLIDISCEEMKDNGN